MGTSRDNVGVAQDACLSSLSLPVGFQNDYGQVLFLPRRFVPGEPGTNTSVSQPWRRRPWRLR